MEETQDKKKLTASFVRKKTLQTTLQQVSQQMYARNKELADTNRMLSLLRTIAAISMESQSGIKQICQEITDAVVESTGYPLIGLFTQPSSHRDEIALYGISTKSWQGKTSTIEFARPPHLKTQSEWFTTGEIYEAIELKGHSAAKIAELLDCTKHEVKVFLDQLPIKSVYVVKLVVRQRVVGLLVAGFLDSVDTIAESDKHLLDRLGGSIGVALDNKLLFEENQHVVHQLQKTNQKLKALDETKDEFISMASHQLRTPLTSVKGYVSMVLEGDAGELNDMQKKLLEQSFASSQRMVYLIADLLNLSRLRTGKFVIEAKPTNLADVIESEVNQLKISAAGRNLTLDYKKPDNFPEIMLDETKIRQVIMNFADNAIYYTPSGGSIDIKLKQTKDSVEFTVNDNGIGIPPEEQRHLFNKFYRAKNAQKARPDGTGLGLFMAKKVIIAQGGAVVFKSVENKGSTFGFTFSKQKLKVPDHLQPKPKTTT